MGSAAAVPQDSCDAAAAAAVAGHTSTGSAATSAQSAAQAAGGAAAAAAVREDTLSSGDGVTQIAAINSQLQRHMRLRNIQTVCVTIFLLGGLSKLQIAEAIVGELELAESCNCFICSVWNVAGLTPHTLTRRCSNTSS
jgi:hypothetical protein